jgi:hypothetical protein
MQNPLVIGHSHEHDDVPAVECEVAVEKDVGEVKVGKQDGHVGHFAEEEDAVGAMQQSQP